MYFALAVVIATNFWGARDVHVPCQPVARPGANAQLQTIDPVWNLPVTATMGARGCEVLLSDLAAGLRREQPDLYCADVVHEVGHIAGLGHGNDGVMNAVIEKNRIWDCAHWKNYARRHGMRIRR